MIALTTAYGLSREPFAQDIPVKNLYPLPGLEAFLQRFEYAIAQRLVTVVTGEVGAGKSTSLRAATARLHPSHYCVIPIVATSGSLMELLRQICIQSGDPPPSNSIARMLTTVRTILTDLSTKKQVPVLIIDEAHTLRLDVFAQLHTLAQVDYDSRSLLPIVLSGQTALIDKLLYHTSRPFASRVVGRSHLESLQREHMEAYLVHHLTVAGGKGEIFADDAVTALHQSSGGILRKAGILARGAMLAAAQERCPVVTAEHVRIATTETL